MARFSLKAIGPVILVSFTPYVDRKQGIFHVPPPKHEGLPNRGFILALGDEARREYETTDGKIKSLEVGDFILYDEKQPEGFKWEGYDVIPVYADNVLAIDVDPPQTEASNE